jgi:hypothetical protein
MIHIIVESAEIFSLRVGAGIFLSQGRQLEYSISSGINGEIKKNAT